MEETVKKVYVLVYLKNARSTRSFKRAQQLCDAGKLSECQAETAILRISYVNRLFPHRKDCSGSSSVSIP